MCLGQQQTVHPASQHHSATSCFFAVGFGLPSPLLYPTALQVAEEYNLQTLSQRAEAGLAERLSADVLE